MRGNGVYHLMPYARVQHRNTSERRKVKKVVKVNDQGRRVGDSHPKAVLTDHEVELLQGFLDEREALIESLRAQGHKQTVIDTALCVAGLSYRKLAVKFEVHWRYIGRIASGERRCQVAISKMK